MKLKKRIRTDFDTGLIPKQLKGGHTSETSMVQLHSVAESVERFQQCCARLNNINAWEQICTIPGAQFRLTDAHGQVLHDLPPKVGQLIRIRLPGPRNRQGDGYDWVRIEETENVRHLITDEEIYGFCVRPVQAPNKAEAGVAHFYTTDASSSFLVIRSVLVVYALERGRNEVPNFSSGIIAGIRRRCIALAAMTGLAKPQWKGLMNDLLHSSST
jgi:hypothetical protein